MSQVSRREVLKLASALGGGALLGEAGNSLCAASAEGMSGDYPLQLAENTIYTSCLQCNTGCPIKVKLYEGVASKIDGNPITPWTMYPHLPYKTSLDVVARVDGGLCPKGQAGIQTAYDPYRIRRVLKRAGPRGSGKWTEISFETAISEIVKGGKTFASIGDTREYPSLEAYWAVRDPGLLANLGKAIQAIWDEKDSAKKRALVAQFKLDFKDHLEKMIDPDHPDLGPKNNQVAMIWGRLKDGRKNFLEWFFRNGFGTQNTHGHTTVCQGSMYFTAKAMSEQYSFDAKKAAFTWGGGNKFYWQGDLTKAKFVIFVGANVFEGNYGPPLRINKLTQGVASGELEYAVIDPRAQKGVANAARWLAPKAGEDAAIALGMIQWIMDNKRFDAKYLSAANKAAAKKLGEPTWSDAAWLVKVENGQPSTLLKSSEVGLGKLAMIVDGKSVEVDAPVVMVNGQPTLFNPTSEDLPVFGDLFVSTVLNGIRVRSGLSLLRREANQQSPSGWAKIAGVKLKDITWLAERFTSHGKHAVVDIHRGTSQHTNGFYNCLAWFSLNTLIGNYDWQGGAVAATTFDAMGAKAGGPFDLANLHPKKLSPVGISLIRHDLKYETTTLFSGYPAKRPWYPNSSDVYQEILPSAAQGYPYAIKIMFHYMGSPAYSLPAGHTQIQAMLDPDRIGLIVASDVTVGDSYMFADYVIPDLSFLERWEFQGSHPSILWKVQPVRQPAIAPIPETVQVYGQPMPISFEALLMGLAEQLGMPGFGAKAFKNGMDFTRPEDFYLKMVANLAFGEKADGTDGVPEASSAELETFLKARRHLPEGVFSESRWKAAVGEAHWKRLVYVLNRGGRFEDFEKVYLPDGTVSRKYAKQVNLYLDKQGTTKNAMTGQPYYPLATYVPPYRDVLGRPVVDDGFELTLITHRIITQTKSRTIADYWLTAIHPENFIAINASDAARLKLRDGQNVKVVSASNPEGVWNLGNGNTKPMIGKLKVIQGIRPGTIAFALGYGHWGYGSSDLEINGEIIKGDARRTKGVHANAAMRVDPVLGDMSLTDTTGGSVVFYESKVNLEPVG